MSGIHKKMLVAGFVGVIWKAYFLTLEKFNFKKRKDCATIKSKYVTGDCEGDRFCHQDYLSNVCKKCCMVRQSADA